MAYTRTNFRTKKALKEAFLSGEEIEVFQPGPFGPDVKDGKVVLEGPHYPEPHRWYVEAEVVANRLVKLKGVK
jgi:hypothetical protein